MPSTAFRVAVALGLLLGVAPGPTAAAGKTAPVGDEPPGLEIEFDVNPLMLCHYYLKSYGQGSTKPRPGSEVDFVSEAAAYAQAVRLSSSGKLWRWFEERVAGSDGTAQLRQAASNLPAALDVGDAGTAVGMLLDALDSAFPKYKKTVYAVELNGLNRVLVGARKRFLGASERIAEALMKQMAFQPVARPVKVLVVVRTGGVTTWGATEDFYFTVIGSLGQSPMSLLEMGIHEATHILDALQSFQSESVLARVRKAADPGDREELEVFLHGLVAFNAGELVKRFLSNSYTHVGVQAPGIGEKFRPYVSTYEFIWTDYMDGKMTVEGVAAKLVEEFEAVQELQAARNKKAP